MLLLPQELLRSTSKEADTGGTLDGAFREVDADTADSSSISTVQSKLILYGSLRENQGEPWRCLRESHGGRIGPYSRRL